MINTDTEMQIDLKSKRPILANKLGGLSGPAIKPIALRMIYEVRQAVSLPIIGMGGIETAEDVVQFLLAGANAIAVGTANFKDPFACPNIIKDLPNVLKEYGYTSVKEAVGGAHE